MLLQRVYLAHSDGCFLIHESIVIASFPERVIVVWAGVAELAIMPVLIVSLLLVLDGVAEFEGERGVIGHGRDELSPPSWFAGRDLPQ